MPITLPSLCIDLDVLKASIHAGLLKDQTAIQMMMLTKMMMPTMQPKTMMTENNDKTAKTLRRNPPVIASTAKEPKPWTKSTANIADDNDNNFLMQQLTTPRMIPMTTNTNRPKK